MKSYSPQFTVDSGPAAAAVRKDLERMTAGAGSTDLGRPREVHM